MNHFDVSIVIVNFNSGDLLSNCLKSIKECINIKYEVIVVDNNSSDSSYENAKYEFDYSDNYFFYNTHSNIGFAKANNFGFDYAKGKLIHFLNPDTELNSLINYDYSYILNNGLFNSVFVNNISDRNGNSIPSKNLIPLVSNIFNKYFRKSKVNYWYTGASIIISKDLFIKIGKWPEDYFMYSEDMDFFFNCHKKNAQIIEFENPIMHIGGGCSSNTWNNFEREIIVQKSFKLFFNKHNKKSEYYIVVFLILIRKLLKMDKDIFFYLKVLYKIKFS
jgi:GT2 family glycosyltransferase